MGEEYGGDRNTMNFNLKAALRERRDVVVVGGGTTGVAAALASARAGASTLLLECNGFLGGNAITGLPWLGFHNRERKRIIGGIPMEYVRDLWKLDAATRFYFDPITGSCIGVNAAMLQLLMLRKVAESKVQTRLNSLFTGIEPYARGKGSHVYFMDRQGLKGIRARVIVDCTDTGEAAVRAGAKSVFGRETDGRPQVASYACCFSNIDYRRLLDYFKAHPGEIRRRGGEKIVPIQHKRISRDLGRALGVQTHD